MKNTMSIKPIHQIIRLIDQPYRPKIIKVKTVKSAPSNFADYLADALKAIK